MTTFVVRPGSRADLDSLEPLWVSVHRQHRATMPELEPYVDEATTWAVRRDLYSDLLGKDGTVLLLAHVGTALVGYGLAHVMALEETWVADTWRTGARIGEIESVAVLPDHRGAGIGTALLDGLEGALADDGVRDLVLGVLPGNTHAIRLYERRGYRPTWSYMSRFDGS
jgi:ribosomal protein S18 acetylase RimI-like enzyme